MAANGFLKSTTFTTADFSNGTGVFLAFMITAGPDSPIGSSSDFASGPIILNTIFPIKIGAQTFTNGVFNDELRVYFRYPPLIRSSREWRAIVTSPTSLLIISISLV